MVYRLYGCSTTPGMFTDNCKLHLGPLGYFVWAFKCIVLRHTVIESEVLNIWNVVQSPGRLQCVHDFVADNYNGLRHLGHQQFFKGYPSIFLLYHYNMRFPQ